MHRHTARHGISDLMATVLLVAMTLIAGAALFGYVNGQAANSETSLGNANASNVNFLNERFVVVDMAVPSFGTPNCTVVSCSATIWIYNNGGLTLNIEQIVLYQASNKQNLYVVFDGSGSSGGCGSASSPAHGSSPGFVYGQGGTGINAGASPVQITLKLPVGCFTGFGSSTTYMANVLGLYGNIVLYSQCDALTGCTN